MLKNLKKNLATVLSIFSIFVISSVMFSLPACVVTTEKGPSYPQEPYSRPSDLRGIQGLWFITASNYPGKLEFYWDRNIWTGRVWFDALQQWEPITNIFLDPRTGELQFTRSVYNQRYTGTLSGNQISGTYTALQGGGGVGSWTATKEPIRRGPVDLREIQGLWLITASNYQGKLEFYRDRNIWTGRVWFDALQQWELLTNIFFDPRTRELQFTRAGANQRYTGTLSGNQFVGTYTALQGGGGVGSWAARRQ